jgi:hypothetical protein
MTQHEYTAEEAFAPLVDCIEKASEAVRGAFVPCRRFGRKDYAGFMCDMQKCNEEYGVEHGEGG